MAVFYRQMSCYQTINEVYYLKEILNKIAEDNSFKIIEINGEFDHVHLLIYMV